MQLNVSLYHQCHRMDSSHAKLQKIATQHHVMMTEVSKIFEVFVLARYSIAEVKEPFQNGSSTLMYDITVVTNACTVVVSCIRQSDTTHKEEHRSSPKEEH